MKSGAAMEAPLRTGLALVCIAALLLPPGVAGYPNPDRAKHFDSDCLAENNRRFVFDYVGLLDFVQGDSVEANACALYQEDGAHQVLVIVPDLDGESIDQYAVHLLREWGIGDDDRLDGLLLLYTMDDGYGQGALRVEVGYGLEGTINSLVAREAVDAAARLKQQALENGSSDRQATAHALSATASGLALFAATNLEGSAGKAESGGVLSWPWWVWIIMLVLLAGLVGGRRGRGSGSFLAGMILGGMMRRGPGGGRGGGGGFGGGKSGGGGWNGRL